MSYLRVLEKAKQIPSGIDCYPITGLVNQCPFLQRIAGIEDFKSNKEFEAFIKAGNCLWMCTLLDKKLKQKFKNKKVHNSTIVIKCCGINE